MSNETKYTVHREIKNIRVRTPFQAHSLMLDADDHETNASFISKSMKACKNKTIANWEQYEREHPTHEEYQINKRYYKEELDTIDYNIKNIQKVSLGWGEINIPYDQNKYIALYENIIYGGVGNEDISNVDNIGPESTLYLNTKIRPQAEPAGAVAMDGNNRKKKRSAGGNRKRSRNDGRKRRNKSPKTKK